MWMLIEVQVHILRSFCTFQGLFVGLLVGLCVAISSCAQTAERIQLKFEMVTSVPNGYIALNGVREYIPFKLNL